VFYGILIVFSSNCLGRCLDRTKREEGGEVLSVVRQEDWGGRIVACLMTLCMIS